jgi:hypothetical protein
MIIRVNYINESYIDYEGVESFELNCEGYLWLQIDDGTDVFVNEDKMTWFRTIKNEEDSTE